MKLSPTSLNLARESSQVQFDHVRPLRIVLRAFSTDIAAMGEDVETPNNYPQLKQYDAWCRRVDEISTAQGWKDLNDVAAKEG